MYSLLQAYVNLIGISYCTLGEWLEEDPFLVLKPNMESSSFLMKRLINSVQAFCNEIHVNSFKTELP